MATLIAVLAFSLIMGLSIFLSYPVVMRKKNSEKMTRLLNSAAIGILIFLMADVFSDVAPGLYAGGSLAGYGANPMLSIAFAIALAVGFFMLYFFENGSKRGLTPVKTSLMIAIGIGLQNLTEGLVFGSAAVSLGLFSGIALVILVGFILQNITEGFPIVAPMMGKQDRRKWVVPALFLVGSIPTILGGAVGFYYSSTLFNTIFDGLAIGAILYVIIPMIRHQVRDVDNLKQKLVYIGIFLGFLIGFLVNLI